MAKLQQSLISLAILKADLDEGRRDYLSYIENFVVALLKTWNEDPVTDGLMASAFEKSYGLRVPHRTMQLVLRRLRKRGYLERKDKTYHPKNELPDFDLDSRREDAIRHINKLYDALISYANTRFSLQWTQAEAADALSSFLGQFGVDCIRAYVFRTALPDIPETAPRYHYVVGSFVAEIYEARDDVFDSVIVFVKGQMYANALTCPDLEGLEKDFKKVTFFLDTPLVLNLLNVQGAEEYDAILELIRLIQRLSGTVAIFEHTAAELESVLRAAEHNIDSPGAVGAVIREMRRSGIKRGDIVLKVSKYEEQLKALGVRIRKTPQYREEFQISEQQMAEEINKQVRYRNPKALEFDINSVRSIFVLREGQIPRRLEDAGAVLVTNNQALSRAAFELGKTHNSAKEVSVVITDFSLANVAWLKSPMDAPTLPEKETLAACYAALEPDPSLWARYLKELDKLKEEGKLSADDHAILRASGFAERELMELTLGEEAQLTGNSITAILERVKEELVSDRTEAVIREKAAHEETRRQFREEQERQAGMRHRIERICDRLATVIYSLFGLFLVTIVFATMLASSGLLGNFVVGSPVATAVLNTLIVVSVVWGTVTVFVNVNVGDYLRRRRRLLASALIERILNYFGFER